MTTEKWHGDTEYDEHPLEEVRKERNGYALVRDGWTLGIDDPGFEPKVGQIARYYGEGIGRPVRGVLLDGRCVYYRTKAEEDKRHDDWVAENRRKREQEFHDQRAERDARFDALPPEFRARIQRFRDGSPDFRVEHEPYELFCCEQAVVIAEALHHEALAKGLLDTEQLNAFVKLEWNEQKKLVPGLDDGHSGNTFGMACRLAYWYLTHPENVAKEHGALTPLVGCQDYGCTHKPPATQEGA